MTDFATAFFGVRGANRVLVVAPYPRRGTAAERFAEFVALVEAANLEPVGIVTAPVREIHPGTYFRRGHLERIRAESDRLDADLVAVDCDLSPAQQKGLEAALGRGALDRTAIILTIFGRRATSRVGKLQVELAQAEYLLPRLVGMWHHFDRERGGIGLRGAGEKQLEIDRRLLRRRITQIRRELERSRRTRDLHRRRRRRTGIPVVAVVGYTNVGKSTLVRRLSGAEILVRDMPFATLDPVTRRVATEDGHPFLLTDTVGFVRDLPHELVDAFHATLEEVLEADLILHVVDASAPDAETQVTTTRRVLEALGAGDRPVLYVLNKLDLADPEVLREGFLTTLVPAVATSLRTGAGLAELRRRLAAEVRRLRPYVPVRIPIERADLIALAEREAAGPGRWSATAVEYDLPHDCELLRRERLPVATPAPGAPPGTVPAPGRTTLGEREAEA